MEAGKWKLETGRPKIGTGIRDCGKPSALSF
jgi:hypothetical protein